MRGRGGAWPPCPPVAKPPVEQRRSITVAPVWPFLCADSEPDGGARVPPVPATGRREPLRRRQRPLFPPVSAGAANQ